MDFDKAMKLAGFVIGGVGAIIQLITSTKGAYDLMKPEETTETNTTETAEVKNEEV